MDNLEYIDAYFQRSLSPQEQKEFENKCVAEKSFAEEVAFYISARQVAKETLQDTKKTSWRQSSTDEETGPIPLHKKAGWYKWVKYAAAACIVLAIATYIFERQVSPQQLAGNYINEHFTHLSLSMGGVEDALEAAKQAINNKDYQTALTILNATRSKQPDNAEIIKYTGIVYLLSSNYDKALEAFDDLSKRSDLFSNPGMFLKAVTLMKRNANDDKANAKQLLETVVDQNLEGSKEAREWLDRF